MPLTSKGKKVLTAMKKTYGLKKGKQVFYASVNKGKIKGVENKGRKQWVGIHKGKQMAKKKKGKKK